MREMLFRGRRIDNGEWVEGNAVKKIDPLLGIAYWFIVRQELQNSCITGEPTILESTVTWYKVEPVTIGQYTGLKDKNDKRIFEGDIVRGNHFWHEKQKIYQVAFDYGEFYLVNDSGTACRHEHIEDIEVIGNIHDNPELLEV